MVIHIKEDADASVTLCGALARAACVVLRADLSKGDCGTPTCPTCIAWMQRAEFTVAALRGTGLIHVNIGRFTAACGGADLSKESWYAEDYIRRDEKIAARIICPVCLKLWVPTPTQRPEVITVQPQPCPHQIRLAEAFPAREPGWDECPWCEVSTLREDVEDGKKEVAYLREQLVAADLDVKAARTDLTAAISARVEAERKEVDLRIQHHHQTGRLAAFDEMVQNLLDRLDER